METTELRTRLLSGLVIPAHPLALNSARRLDERRQRALTRYYIAAGSGGLAVGVHTTQFAIRRPEVGLFRPVLELALEEVKRSHRGVVTVGGICGSTVQACREAELLAELGYDAGLVSLAAFPEADESELIEHCRALSEVLPLMGFYLQPAVGGRLLSLSFWRRFFEIERVVAVKVAPFNRYQTLDVVRALADSGRLDVALYTGNDDSIVSDLVTPFRFGGLDLRFAGGLLGHWAVWTRRAVELLARCRIEPASAELLRLGCEITDCNAAFFDAANNYRGCIAGLHEVLRRQGLLEGTWCLDPAESLSPGQSEEIDRVCRAYPHLSDDDFVAENLAQFLS
jgi:dihydrodipicolinate synthase/N-acetylneuraminate lyase